MRKSLSHGALVGLLVTLPLVGQLYAGWKVLDFPFTPFDLFDWTTRMLPGAAATAAVDAMVRVTGSLPFGGAATAKVIEQSLAIGLVLGLGTVLGAVLLTALSASDEPASLLGVVLGLTLGGVAVVLEQNLNRLTSPGAFVQGSWVFVMHCFWGAALGWSSGRIRTFDVPQPMQVTPTRSSGERRLFLRRLGAATVSIAAFGTGLGVLFGRAIDGLRGERWSSTHALPNAAASVAPVPGTRPEFTTVERHYRIDAVTRPPALNGDRWRLRVGGLIAQPLEMTLDEVRSHEPLHQFVTLACISNPVGGDLISTTRWTGVSLQRLVGVWRPGPTASHLKFISADGFSEVVALERVMADARVMLAYAWDGVPLPVSHGFPLRLYVPDVYGMKQPKWIQAVEVLDHWEPGYWVERGWDREGRMKSSAVVDVVAANAQTASAERLAPVSIGGIAHAGARGIAKVEVQVDGGEWQRAELRDPLSETTWVVWRADMPLASGDHTVTARSYEGDGAPQTSASHTKRART